jgi:NAD(P)-dependent dehydrogenase (short-subunit alcohol dehydrogenase family)
MHHRKLFPASTFSCQYARSGRLRRPVTKRGKAGIIGLSLPASRDLAGTGIRVKLIVGGGFDTPILTGIVGTDDKVTEALAR